MTSERREPDEPDAPGECGAGELSPRSGEPGSPRGDAGPRGELSSADVEAAFARIVAGWDVEGVPRERTADSPDAGRPSPTPVDADDTPTQALPRIVTPEELPEPPVDEEDDHFVPPEPPPFPRPQPATVGAVCLFLLGIVLLVAPGVIGFSSQYGLPLGLLSITGAIVWLVARLRQGPPTDSGWDDGAQI